MIPKIIHYVWFGQQPYPELAERCITSWKKYCPDYEFKLWNEKTFTNESQNQYCHEALEHKKWAFASDYVRLWALYTYGGIYLDTDVELLGSLDDLLSGKRAVFGFEDDCHVSTGIIAAEKQADVILHLLKLYDKKQFLLPDGRYDLSTNVELITDALCTKGLILNGEQQSFQGVTVYPSDFFSPKDSVTRKLSITGNTKAIHYFDGSWCSEEERDLLLARDKLTSFLPKMPTVIEIALALLMVCCRKRSVYPILAAYQRERSRILDKSKKR